MKSKCILTLLAGLLLILPVLAWAQPSPLDSVILESKTVAPGADAGPTADTSAYIYQKVSITNKDSLTALTVSLSFTSTLNGGYATLGWPRNFNGTISRLTSTLAGSLIFFSARYHSNSPDSALWAGVYDPLDPATLELPNAVRKDIWEIKYDSASAAPLPGIMHVDSVRTTQPTGFTNTVPRDVLVNFKSADITIDVPACLFSNCGGAGGNLLYGRPYSYDFNTNSDPTVVYSVQVGPGSINPATGVYSFSGQCPLGAVPVTVRATDPSSQKFCECQFTLNIIDNAPSCTPAQPTVTVSHGALASNQINKSDPDAGDVVSVAQTSGPGSTTAGGAWSYQTSCQDVAASPQTVQEQVVDGFGNCIPGPLSATCQFQLVVTNAAPTAICPPNGQAQAGQHYTAQASATDPDAGETFTFSLASGPAGLTVSPSGQVNWDPTPADAGAHQVCIRVTDACGATAQCCYTVTVVVGQRFHICIDTIKVPYQGGDVDLAVSNLVQGEDPNTPSSEAVGGFSFLFSYDCSCLQFLSARKGAMLVNQRWEFFTYRFGAIGNGNCGAGCPSCLIRVVAIADVNNGSAHPVNNQNNQGEWVVLRFRTSSDLTLAGQCCQVNWYWFDCNDNTISDSTGNTLWTAEQLLNADGSAGSLEFPTVNVNNCDQVSGGDGKPSPKKFIIFCNGLICLPTIQEIDDRGDINQNGTLNEIADAVLFENYFIYGSSVFNPNPQRRAGQIAATDVNGDGNVLTVADLIQLLRIITGDANPLPRMTPAEGAVSLALSSTGSGVSLAANSASDLGGLYLKFPVEGSVGSVALTGAAEGMSMKTNLVGNELSVLIYSENKDQKIAPNAGAILSMSVEGSVTIKESDAADYYGIGLPTLTKASALPTAFGLSQNYPNPFNGRTTLTLALPVTSDYKVTVYNVAGQVVRTYEGSAGPGNKTITWDGLDRNGAAVSSGVYFFKAVAGSYKAVVKGLYLK
jgi:hypothetical protein